MRAHILKLAAFAAFLAVTGAGCSGGSSSSPPATTGASKGVITALGSIFVNGVEYGVTGASVTVDKSSGTSSDLLVGKVVTVKGAKSDDTHGTATTVEYKDNLEGPVDMSPDLANNRFQALGQTIAVNTTAATVAAGKTVFRNFTSLAQLTSGSVVEVSGMPDANGVIQGSFIELKGTLAAGTGIELKGKVANLNTTAKTFTIGALTVDYTTATLSDLGSGIANGLFVEVSGTGAGYTGGASPQLVATKVESNREDANGIDGHDLSVEGFVSGFTAGSNTFMVSGQTINAGTLSLAGIANNVKVEVEGVLSGGVLMATKISLR